MNTIVLPRRNLRILLTLSSGAAALGLAAAAHAQTAPTTPEPDQASSSATVQEIIVTAQRREQKLQDVPIAITAFSAQTLEARNVTSFSGIAGFAPNVKIITYYRQTSPAVAIRGSVTVNPSPTFDPAVGLYIDGVYTGKSYGSLFVLAVIERIEILRGPQGTLYGRNTLAGALNIVTSKPSGEFKGEIKAGVGDYNRRVLRGSVDLPEYNHISVKLTGLINQQDGFVEIKDNPFPNVAAAQPRLIDRAGDINRRAARVAIRYTPTNDITIDYAFDYSQTNDSMGYLQPTGYGKGGIFDPASPSYVGGKVGSTYFGFPFNLYVMPNSRSLVGYADGSPGGPSRANQENIRNRQHTLTAAWDLGPVTLKSISSYRKLQSAWWNDVDGTPFALIQSNMDMDYTAYSQEFQAIGSIGTLQYTGGLYYYKDNGFAFNPQVYFGGAASYTGGYGFSTKSLAAYGQVEWKPHVLDDKLSVIGGLRYTTENKGVTRDWTGNFGGGPVVVVPAGTHANKDFHRVTPTVTVKYDITDRINVYARYAEGFKSGGFNGEADTVVGTTTPYSPELVTSYELGMKGRFLDNRLQINVAVFNDDHRDMQLSVFRAAGSLTSEIINAGRATIRGLEVEADFQPTEWLNISGNIGTLDPKYKQFLNAGVDESSTRAFPSAPKLTSSASVDARLFRSDRFGDLHLMIDYTHSDPYYNFADPKLDPASPAYATGYSALTTEADSSDIYDARLRLIDIPAPSGKLEASLWVKNITNSSDRVFGIDFGPSFGHAVISNYNAPRTFGADLSYKF